MDGAVAKGGIKDIGKFRAKLGQRFFGIERQIFRLGPRHRIGGLDDHAGSNPYAITITLSHESTADVVVGSTAVVSDPAVTPTGGFTFTAVEGTPSATQTVATFTDPGGPEAAVFVLSLASYLVNNPDNLAGGLFLAPIMDLRLHVEKFARRLTEVEAALSDPKVFDNKARAQELSREYARLKDLVAIGEGSRRDLVRRLL